ncbi:hypothetical protein [Demequina globuliformis]|nr:hypothetical protein [Demequina globuliformis]
MTPLKLASIAAGTVITVAMLAVACVWGVAGIVDLRGDVAR